MSDLDRAVRAVVRDCLGVKDGEEVLVVCNPATQHLGERLRDEAAKAGADAVLALMSERASHAAEAKITDANGTDLTLDLSGREAIPDAGELTERSAFGNLPCGEGFISPVTGNGTLVIDGSMAGIGLVDDPIEMVIEGGHLTSAR